MRPVRYTLGLIGYPLGHSLSPRLHAAALQALDLQGEYLLYPVPPGPQVNQAIQALFEQVRSGEIHGLNITIPHKQTVIPLLDVLTPTAQAVGAVNTIYSKANVLTGDNTDCPGFLADLAFQFGQAGLGKLSSLPGRSALVLGAGGSARAVVFGLLQNGWQVSIATRRPEQARALVRSLGFPSTVTGGMDLLHSDRIQKMHLIVNTTPVGMHPNENASPWPAGLPLPPAAFLYDLVYNPAETALLHSTREAGLAAANGLGMLVRQAVLAFRLWTGLEPPWEVLYRAAASPLPAPQISTRK